MQHGHSPMYHGSAHKNRSVRRETLKSRLELGAGGAEQQHLRRAPAREDRCVLGSDQPWIAWKGIEASVEHADRLGEHPARVEREPHQQLLAPIRGIAHERREISADLVPVDQDARVATEGRRVRGRRVGRAPDRQGACANGSARR